MFSFSARSSITSSPIILGGRVKLPAYTGVYSRCALRRWIVLRAASALQPKCTRKIQGTIRKFSLTRPDARQQPAPLSDPEHPSLFYHIFTEETGEPVFALSLDEDRPPHLRSRTVLGWLPARLESESNFGGSGLNDFTENRPFIDMLQNAVREGMLEDEIWVNGAIQTHSGWMHIYDQRNPPPLGRIPDTADIIGTVLVNEGKLVPDTYAPMPSYRMVTSDGVMSLTDSIHRKLKTALIKVAEEERKQ